MEAEFGMLPFNAMRLDGTNLIVSSTGQWCFLDDDEFDAVAGMKLIPGTSLFRKLSDSGMLVSGGNIDMVVSEYRSLNSFVFREPSLHIVIPTLRCNQNCVYCHAKPADSSGTDMDLSTAVKVIDFVFQSNSPAMTLELQGGEPLLNWDVTKFIIRESRKLNETYEKKQLGITMVSNLTLMDEEKLDFLIKNGVTICTSLDGPAAIHDGNRTYCGGVGTHADVVKWIERIRSEQESRGMSGAINALPTITRHSLPRWKEIVDEYVRLGFDTISLRFLNKLGEARSNWGSISYSPEEFVTFWKKSMDYIIELNKNGVHLREFMAKTMLAKIIGKTDPGFTELMNPCGAARNQIAYNYNGDIYTCDEGRMVGNDMFRLGRVGDGKYAKILAGEKVAAICYASVLSNYCGTCPYQPYCGTCPVMNYAEQGSIVPKMAQSTRCKIYKSQFTYLFNMMAADSAAAVILRGWVDEGIRKKEAA